MIAPQFTFLPGAVWLLPKKNTGKNIPGETEPLLVVRQGNPGASIFTA